MPTSPPPETSLLALLRVARPVNLAFLTLLLLVAAGLSAGSGSAGSSSRVVVRTDPAALVAPSASHPYSDPVWSPLRKPSVISCVRTNCRGSDGTAYHGYWAIDFLGDRGDPVYAAGAGVLHVGAAERTCSTTSSQSPGTWVWVDHGGGVVTKYTHLDSVAVADGSRVTPQTMIGRMGHWGDTAPCTTDYLHFELRTGGVTGTRVEPKRLLACTASGTVTMPAIFGVTSFDQLAKAAASTPAASSACVTDSWNGTPAKPAVAVRAANSALRLAWGTPPAGTTAVRAAWQVWSPSLQRWSKSTYVTFAGTATGGTISGLTNGRSYRLWVAVHNASGWSAWSATATGVPATVPSVPKSPRYLTWPSPDYVHYGWWKSQPNGRAVSRYDTQVRCYKDGRYRAWTTRSVNGSTYYYNHRGLSGYRTCQVRVRAVNAMGASAWSAASTIRR